MHIQDPVTLTFRFARPAGPDGNIRVSMTFDGIPDDLAAALQAGFAIGKAQIAAKATRRRGA